MPEIRVDLDRVRHEVVKAEAAVERAGEHAEQAERDLQVARNEVAVAEADLAFIRRVERAILDAAVETREDIGLPPLTTPYSEPGAGAELTEAEGTAAPPVDGMYANMPTRGAVLAALRAERGRVWALGQLVAYLQQNGFSGTQNAVHVALSRLKGAADAGDIERVKMGHYRSLPTGTASDVPEGLARDLGLGDMSPV
jgi:hypothetical protein